MQLAGIVLKALCSIALGFEDELCSEMSVELEGTATSRPPVDVPLTSLIADMRFMFLDVFYPGVSFSLYASLHKVS